MIQNHLDESPSEILVQALQMIMEEDAGTDQLTVLLPFELSAEFSLPDQQVPVIGDKKRLVEMAQLNARLAFENYIKKKSALEGKSSEKRILEQLQTDLRMKDLPTHIECFDNSNIMGTFPVSAMVVFKNGKASKTDYRHFNVKTVEGPDDFSTMREVIRRRYSRLKEENAALPKLIIVDGGKGQLSSAVIELKELGLYGKIPIIGIAKKLEEIYYPEDPIPLHISKKSESLKLIQRIRDEAHRFGINHHRQRRDKAMTNSELDQITGLGEATKEKLLNHFKSVKKIRQASFEELAGIIGPSRAKRIKDSLQAEN